MPLKLNYQSPANYRSHNMHNHITLHVIS